MKTLGISAVTLTIQKNTFPAGAKPKTQETRPNILVILVDDLGYGDLSSYGAKDLRTPNIDRLMSAGKRIDNFYANCPVCSPTRASLLTGRYPDMVGVPGVIRTFPRNNFGFLDPNALLLPTVLKTSGYHTAIVGKWHLGLESPNIPTERGFDYFYGFLGDMMEDYYTHRRAGYNYMRLNQEKIDPKGHATDLFTQAAIDYIRSRKNEKKPFFFYLAYNAPHTPIQPPEEWVEKVKNREKGIEEKRARLVALIEHLDDGIGNVIKTLKDSALSENTIIFFISDNGGQLNVGGQNGNLNGGKGNMFEGGIRVPMCAVWPQRIKPGVNTNLVAMTMDIFPTLCDMASTNYDHKIDGVSILPELLGKKQFLEDRFLVWVRREGGRFGGRDYYAIRKGDYKLLQNSPYEPMKLYNLKEDPWEKKPYDNDHEMHKILANALQDHVIKAGTVPWQKNPVKLEK